MDKPTVTFDIRDSRKKKRPDFGLQRKESNLFRKRPPVKLNIKDSSSPFTFTNYGPHNLETDDVDKLLNSRLKDKRK